MDGIRFSDVVKTFGGMPAVSGVSFEVAPGAFFALLGPSGCGKTTVLRLVAGLERPDAGRIEIGGREVAGPGAFIPAERRNLGMVFQSYALWPHMSVAGNVAFGLALRGLRGAAKAARVAEALALVGLGEHASRRPHELSGGQRQRVALARSLAARPSIVLLDEPLANLDAHLREAMLAEFRRIHRASRTTFVFVTHDQDEAMALADLVAVMDRGRVEQIAPPPELYARPATPMVARFVGRGRTVPVSVVSSGGAVARVRLQDRIFAVPGAAGPGPGWLCLRARDLAPAEGAAPEWPRLLARVTDRRFEGGDHVLSLALEGVDEGPALDLRGDAPRGVGERLEIALRGGWVLPRAA